MIKFNFNSPQRLRREADPEPEPANRPVYIPPPRPPHPVNIN
ncbi:MAG: hypothetical protein J6569_11225 [Gilliamella sp.]|nr:hypothetical protein [Gilliamella sp.]